MLCHFVCTLAFMLYGSKLQRQLMQFHQSAKDWKYLFLLLFFRRRFWPWRDQNPMVIPLSDLKYDVDEKFHQKNASMRCQKCHFSFSMRQRCRKMPKCSNFNCPRDDKVVIFLISKDVNLLQSPTNLFYLKALVSFGGNPNLVHEKSSIFFEFIFLNSFHVCPKKWPSIQDHKEKHPCPLPALR